MIDSISCYYLWMILHVSKFIEKFFSRTKALQKQTDKQWFIYIDTHHNTYARVQQIEQCPQFASVVLQRRARQQQQMINTQHFHRL